MSVRAGLERLGDPANKTEREFRDALGRPRVVYQLVNGRRMLQWRSGGFHPQRIAVVFDASARFVKISVRYQV